MNRCLKFLEGRRTNFPGRFFHMVNIMICSLPQSGFVYCREARILTHNIPKCTANNPKYTAESAVLNEAAPVRVRVLPGRRGRRETGASGHKAGRSGRKAGVTARRRIV